MGRIDARFLLVLPLLALGACGDDEPDPAPAPAPAVTISSAPAPIVPSSGPAAEPSPGDSVFEEEDVDPTAAPGDLPDEVQAYLDEAIGRELGALESATPEQADGRRKALDRLPEQPDKVLVALKSYSWFSPEAKTLYDKAVAATK